MSASRILIGLTALSLVAACGDDGPTGTNGRDPLTAAEGLAVVDELQAALALALSPPPWGDAPAPISASAECSGGGSISIDGDVDATEQPVSFDITESINRCVVTVNNIDFTVKSDPSIRLQGDITIGRDFSLSGAYSMMGGFRYTFSDDRTGSCALDVSINFATLSVDGTICGVDSSGSAGAFIIEFALIMGLDQIA